MKYSLGQDLTYILKYVLVLQFALLLELNTENKFVNNAGMN